MPEYIVREGIRHERALKALKTIEPGLEQVCPEQLRSFQLLEQSSLPTQLKVSVRMAADNDYTPESAQRRLRDHLGHDEQPEVREPSAMAERLMKRRWAIVNVWRSASDEAVLHAPMTLCDARCV